MHVQKGFDLVQRSISTLIVLAFTYGSDRDLEPVLFPSCGFNAFRESCHFAGKRVEFTWLDVPAHPRRLGWRRVVLS